MSDGNPYKTAAALEIITALGIMAFWVLFHTVGMAPANPPEYYFHFEKAFPLPDFILSVALLCAGAMLLKGNPAGKVLSLACCGGLCFLGVVDFSFNIQSGVYASSTMDLLSNGFINFWCVAFGTFIFIKIKKEQTT